MLISPGTLPIPAGISPAKFARIFPRPPPRIGALFLIERWDRRAAALYGWLHLEVVPGLEEAKCLSTSLGRRRMDHGAVMPLGLGEGDDGLQQGGLDFGFNPCASRLWTRAGRRRAAAAAHAAIAAIAAIAARVWRAARDPAFHNCSIKCAPNTYPNWIWKRTRQNVAARRCSPP